MCHWTGIHFDAGFYGVKTEKTLTAALEFERQAFQKILELDVRVFSFHNPGRLTAKFKGISYAGMINAYSDCIIKQADYCSDSNGYWRYRRLEDVLRQHLERRLQVLTHPAWWTERPMAPRERIFRCVQGRAQRCMDDYDLLLLKSRRKNI